LAIRASRAQPAPRTIPPETVAGEAHAIAQVGENRTGIGRVAADALPLAHHGGGAIRCRIVAQWIMASTQMRP
jgi:hypothetical protein